MRLSELKGEKALEALGEIIEPAVKIMQDPAVAAAARAGNTLEIVKIMCKDHKREVITMLAVLDDQDPATYEVGLLTLPAKLLELLNDPEVQMLFTQRGRTEGETPSGSASENTKGRKKQGSS